MLPSRPAVSMPMANFLFFHWASGCPGVADRARVDDLGLDQLLDELHGLDVAVVDESSLPSVLNRPPPLLIIIMTMACAPRLLPAPAPVAKP